MKSEPSIGSLLKEYPLGTMWQDDSSIKEDELVDVWVMTLCGWDFLGRFRPLQFIGRHPIG